MAEEKRAEAVDRQQRAVAAARAANEQNRIAVEAQVELIVLLERKLRFVPAIQNEREQILDKAITRLEGAAQAMTNLRPRRGMGPQGRERHNWRSLARAHRTRGDVSLSRNQLADAMAQFRQAEEIIAQARGGRSRGPGSAGQSDPDPAPARVRLNEPTGRHGGSAEVLPQGDRDQPGVPGEEARPRRLQE